MFLVLFVMILEKGKGEGGWKIGNEEEINWEGNVGKSRVVFKFGVC